MAQPARRPPPFPGRRRGRAPPPPAQRGSGGGPQEAWDGDTLAGVRLPYVLLLAAAAGGVAWLLLRPQELPAPAAPTKDPLEEELLANPWMHFKTGTLVVRVAGPDGVPPTRAEVGYVHEGRPRWYGAEAGGRRVLVDVPLGELEVMARAPGYVEGRQRRTLLAGVPDEVLIVLAPEPGPGR